MIKRFAFKNFLSFKEGAEINFNFGKAVPLEVSNGLKVSTVLGIKGSNGSGKTNIIKALGFLQEFCVSSSQKSEGDNTGAQTYFDNNKPAEFLVEFDIHKNSYFYELEITNKVVVREEIYRKKERKTSILKRHKSEITNTIKSLSELKDIKIRNNESVISLFKKYNFKSSMPDLKSIYNFFYMSFSNVNKEGYIDLKFDYENMSEKFYKSPEMFQFIKDVIKTADSGIKDIEIKKRYDENGKEIYFPVFWHEHEGTSFYLTFHNESSGTKKLYESLVLYRITLDTGCVLSLDEFDIHIHSIILPTIIGWFTNKETNPKNAQFIFTSHNTEIIDTLGKYRTILVNKDDNESYCYRLDEIPGSMIRNDRAIMPLYLDGKIGGVPNVHEGKDMNVERG